MIRKNPVGTAFAVLTTAVVLAGCGGGDQSGNHHLSSAPNTTGAVAPAGEHNDADIAFAQGMIPHHEGAIEMARTARGRTGNQAVLDLASRVEEAQDPEIETMTGWLTAWGAEVAPGGGHAGHGSSMPGMGEEEVAALEAARDADFDRLFLETMIEHHRGAIDMAGVELRSGGNAGAKTLAQKIIDDQRAEIAEMREMLRAMG
ncbi:DUF305 domain-containing protein [Actinosynnema sp. NPDC059797]